MAPVSGSPRHWVWCWWSWGVGNVSGDVNTYEHPAGRNDLDFQMEWLQWARHYNCLEHRGSTTLWVARANANALWDFCCGDFHGGTGLFIWEGHTSLGVWSCSLHWRSPMSEDTNERKSGWHWIPDIWRQWCEWLEASVCHHKEEKGMPYTGHLVSWVWLFGIKVGPNNTQIWETWCWVPVSSLSKSVWCTNKKGQVPMKM